MNQLNLKIEKTYPFCVHIPGCLHTTLLPGTHRYGRSLRIGQMLLPGAACLAGAMGRVYILEQQVVNAEASQCSECTKSHTCLRTALLSA